MVLVTHDSTVARRAQRIGVMKNGRLNFKQPSRSRAARSQAAPAQAARAEAARPQATRPAPVSPPSFQPPGLHDSDSRTPDLSRAEDPLDWAPDSDSADSVSFPD